MQTLHTTAGGFNEQLLAVASVIHVYVFAFTSKHQQCVYLYIHLLHVFLNRE